MHCIKEDTYHYGPWLVCRRVDVHFITSGGMEMDQEKEIYRTKVQHAMGLWTHWGCQLNSLPKGSSAYPHWRKWNLLKNKISELQKSIVRCRSMCPIIIIVQTLFHPFEVG